MSAQQKAMFAKCRQLGIDEDTRHAMLREITGKASSRDLTPAEWRRVHDHLERLGGGAASPPNEWAWVDSAAPDRQPQLRKLIMLAKSAGIERGGQICYLEGIARQAAGLPRGISKPLRLCDTAELRVLVQALSVHIRRQAKRAATVAAGETPALHAE